MAKGMINKGLVSLWQRTIRLRKAPAAWIHDPTAGELLSETMLRGSHSASAMQGTQAFNLEHLPVVLHQHPKLFKPSVFY